MRTTLVKIGTAALRPYYRMAREDALVEQHATPEERDAMARGYGLGNVAGAAAALVVVADVVRASFVVLHGPLVHMGVNAALAVSGVGMLYGMHMWWRARRRALRRIQSDQAAALGTWT